MNQLPRRVMLRRALQVFAAAAVIPAIEARRASAKSCEDPSSESLRTSLHYSAMSPDPAKACGACGFFTNGANGSACGNCAIMSGDVNVKGHCDSWAAKSGK
jgi:hypothetical protein